MVHRSDSSSNNATDIAITISTGIGNSNNNGDGNGAYACFWSGTIVVLEVAGCGGCCIGSQSNRQRHGVKPDDKRALVASSFSSEFILHAARVQLVGCKHTPLGYKHTPLGCKRMPLGCKHTPLRCVLTLLYDCLFCIDAVPTLNGVYRQQPLVRSSNQPLRC